MSIPIKEYYILLETQDSNKVYNIVPFSYSTYKSFSLTNNELDFVKRSISMVLEPLKSDISFGYLLNQIQKDDYLVVRSNDFLPAVFTSDGILVINFSVLSNENVSMIPTKVLITLFLYSFYLRKTVELALKNKLYGLEGLVSEFFYSLFVKLFRKKQGLVGFDELLKQLKFFCSLYVFVSLFGYEYDKKLVLKLASACMVDPTKLKLDYDLSDPREFFKCLNDNSIMSISSMLFTSELVQRFDVYSIVTFEDVCRFIAHTISVGGSSLLFSKRWLEIRSDVLQKIIQYIKNIK